MRIQALAHQEHPSRASDRMQATNRELLPCSDTEFRSVRQSVGRTYRDANRPILIEGDPLPVRLSRSRAVKGCSEPLSHLAQHHANGPEPVPTITSRSG